MVLFAARGLQSNDKLGLSFAQRGFGVETGLVRNG